MKVKNWKRAAIAMTIGALVSCIPGKVFADEIFVEDDSVVFAEDFEEEEEFLELETEGVFEEPVFLEDEEDVLFEDDEFEEDAELLTEGSEEELQISTSSGTWGDNLTWTLDESGTLTISGTGKMKGYDSNTYYTEGKFPWTDWIPSIVDVVIEDGITSIGGWAFYLCRNLKSVTIPDSVTIIEECAFEYCESLTSVTIPDSVTSIENCAFKECRSLTSVTIPDGVPIIRAQTFYNCESLTSVTIPNSVTKIEPYAFEYCFSELKDIYYTGSKKDWAAINISVGNPRLSSANIHYVDPNVRLEIEFENGKDTYVYKGEAVIPDVVVRGYKKNNDGSEEEVDAVDYTLTYKDNDIENPETDTVTATVTATGHGDFEGHTSTKAFTIQYNEVYLTYLEVGFGGNVTVHWGFNGNEDTISGFEVQHSWKDTVNDPDGLRTTEVSGSDKREIDIVDLSYNTYEFRVRAVSKDADDGDPKWTDWAECPVKEIKILNPEAGTTYADSFVCMADLNFGTNVKPVTGTMSLYDNNNNKLTSFNIVENPVQSYVISSFTTFFGNITDPMASSPNSILSPGTTYHIAVDEKSIEYMMEGVEGYPVPVYFAGIKATDKTTWNFTTVSTSYPGLRNYEDRIDDEYVELLFKPQHCKQVKKDLLSGVVARCWGLCYLVGAYKNAYTYIMSIAPKSGGYDNLGQVPINEGSLLSRYVDMAHLYQFRPEYYITDEDSDNTDLEILYNAIKSGNNLVISIVSTKGGHVVLPISIIDDSDYSHIKIAVYDSNCRQLASTLNYGDVRSFVQTAELDLSSEQKQFYYKEYTFDHFQFITNDVDSACGGEIRSYDDKYKLLTSSSIPVFIKKGNHIWKINGNGADSENSENSTNQNIYDYWLEGNSYHYDEGEPNTITLAGGIDKLCATLDAGQSATLDLETNSVTIDGAASDNNAGDYTIRFSKAEDYNTFHDTVISGTSGGVDTILTKTEDGISVETDANTVISVSTEENDTETANTKVKLTDGSAQIRADENGAINVFADLDGDGSYTDVVQPIDDSNESGAGDNGSGSVHPGSSDQKDKPSVKVNTAPADKITVTKKPSIKKPTAKKTSITVSWKHFKHTSKKTKKIWKKIKKVQVQCATDKAFKNIVKTWMVKKSKTKATIKGLKKKTTYYVRVRYYDGTGYSNWSSTKKIKTKK